MWFLLDPNWAWNCLNLPKCKLPIFSLSFATGTFQLELTNEKGAKGMLCDTSLSWSTSPENDVVSKKRNKIGVIEGYGPGYISHTCMIACICWYLVCSIFIEMHNTSLVCRVQMIEQSVRPVGDSGLFCQRFIRVQKHPKMHTAHDRPCYIEKWIPHWIVTRNSPGNCCHAPQHTRNITLFCLCLFMGRDGQAYIWWEGALLSYILTTQVTSCQLVTANIKRFASFTWLAFWRHDDIMIWFLIVVLSCFLNHFDYRARLDSFRFMLTSQRWHGFSVVKARCWPTTMPVTGGLFLRYTGTLMFFLGPIL